MSHEKSSLDPRLVLVLVIAIFALVLVMIGGVIWIGFNNRLPQKLIEILPTPFFLFPAATPTIALNESDVRNVAVIATYEAQIFPEPDKSRAYRAIIWTIRNRVMAGQGIVSGYSDEQNVLAKYTAFQTHRNDPPDPRAFEIALEVMRAPTNADDPIQGARHYVDNSYWTGTHEQIGARPKISGKYADADVQKLVDDGKFVSVIEWRAPPGHPKGALFYGLYFFDYWPPPMPAYPPPTLFPTATRTFTPRPTASTTKLAPTATPTFTPALTATLTMTPTLTITPTAMFTPTLATPTLPPYP